MAAEQIRVYLWEVQECKDASVESSKGSWDGVGWKEVEKVWWKSMCEWENYLEGSEQDEKGKMCESSKRENLKWMSIDPEDEVWRKWV